MKIPEIFPFDLSVRVGNATFQSYFQPRREEINEKYGHTVFTGRGLYGNEKSWSYYEVDAKVIDAVTIEFQTYGMLDSVYGGRGAAQDKFVHKFDTPRNLKDSVEQRKREIATYVFDQRALEAARKKREEDIDEVYRELFRPQVQ